MQELRQSSEIKVRVGSAVDATDGVSPETGLTLGAADQAELLKHNGAATVDISGNTFAAVTAVDGWYDLTLTSGNTDTLGQLTVVIQDSSLMAPIFRDFMVVTANFWDSKYSTDKLQVDVTLWRGFSTATPSIAGVPEVDVTHWIGTAAATPTVAGVPEVDVTHMAGGVQTVTDLKDFADAGYDPATNKVQGVVLADTVTTLTGHTAQTGDSFARIGAAGASLTAVPWNASWDAEVESECNDALVALKLDHLIAVADADDVVDNSVIAKLAALGATADWSTYVNTTDSLQAIRDRGDAAWTTGAGGSDRLLMVDTTIATLASQTSFTLTAGSADDNAYNNCTIVIEDVTTATQKAVGIISAYTGATKTVTLKYDPAVFTMETTDKVYVLAENALKATLANRQLNVAADGDIAGNVDGSVASVVGAVGSVTGNVGGNVTGSVGSLVGHTVQTGDTYALANGASGFVNIIADTNELQGDWVNGGRLDLILDIIAADTTTDIPATISTMQGNVTDILADTNELQGDWANAGRLDTILDACALEATVAALNNISAADVNTQVSDVIKTDTISEMAQGVPSATPTLEDAIMYLYMAWRNETTTTSTTHSVKNDGGTVITKATISDDATTFTKGEMASGP